ncbi:MAG TPA: Ig-like domain-containing protein [Streptosporangiaceae bacterium]|nr:Ig-like domain-containing protein [Streptosporangiaceae bacterium]
MRSQGKRYRLAPVAVVCATGILAAACHSSSGSGGGGGASGQGTSSPDTVQLSITPASGSTGVNPRDGITVKANKGTISSVTVAGDGLTGQRAVTGTLNSAKTVWHTDWALPVDETLKVTATGADSSGHSVTQTSTFKTLRPAQTFVTHIFEGYKDTYGVGMPIMLTFSQPIKNRAAVERSLQITTSKPVVGAWYWDNSQTLAFRPRDYWPAHTTVSFVGHLDGVEASPGVYGDHTLTQDFSIGKSLIVVASTAKHHMWLYRNGKLLRHWPISTGKPGDNTPNGTYLTIEKHNPVLMKGPGYRIEVPWSVRFTWSGDYLHDAYWSTSQQGFENVSHGCVNMPPAASKFYYKMAVPGDPVTIVGSPRGGVWDNGWTHWFLSWRELLKGSALHQAVMTGPNGSTFVDPSTISSSTATSPLGTSKWGNSKAS